MTLTTTRSAISRAQKELADLRTKDASEARKEADLLSKFNRAMEGASKASSSSTQTLQISGGGKGAEGFGRRLEKASRHIEEPRLKKWRSDASSKPPLH